MSSVVSLHRVSKSYRAGISGCGGCVEALREVNLTIRAGELLGVLGSLGSGKSTLLLTAAGLLRPDAGTVTWFGESTPGVPPNGVSYVREQTATRPGFTVRESLALPARWCENRSPAGSRAIEVILERAGLETLAGRPASLLSGEMLQRYAVAQAVLERPRLLLLDGTLGGLHPPAVRGILQLLRELCDGGGAVVLSSSEPGPLEQLVDRLVVLREGRMLNAIESGVPCRARTLGSVPRAGGSSECGPRRGGAAR